jgi:serine/threonine protein phosphatase PrpC
LEAFTQVDVLQQSAGLPLWASGTCVSAAAVSPTHIAVANCGDCRCVLADQGVALDLSQDHNVESATPEEIQRILSSGGVITPDKRVTLPGAPGRLAATRSLGDYWAKPRGALEKHVISGLPEVRIIPRQLGQQYLILASDGIFGFMSSQDVVSLCLSASEHVAPTAALSCLAHTVVCTAVNAKRSDDNCTCLVVDLNRLQASFSPGPPLGMGIQPGGPLAAPNPCHRNSSVTQHRRLLHIVGY